MVVVGFGTAHLYGLVTPDGSNVLLDAAVRAGFGRIDTAPSYGFGRSEIEVGLRVAAAGARSLPVTTKVGLEPANPPSRGRRALSRLAEVLPDRVVSRLRHARSSDPAAHTPTGRFSPAAVGASVERSLRRLGRLDRLVLHEVAPADIDEALLDLLAAFVRRGDVGALGVATQNDVTAEAVRRGGGAFTVVHQAAGPFAEPVELPAGLIRVGHGLLGPGGSDLRRVQHYFARQPDVAADWDGAVAGTSWSGPEGLVQALLQRAHAQPLDEVVVATSRLAALPSLAALRDPPDDIADDQWSALDLLLARVRG